MDLISLILDAWVGLRKFFKLQFSSFGLQQKKYKGGERYEQKRETVSGNKGREREAEEK